MKMQQTINQKGEIEFRKKLVLQQVEHQRIFSDEFDAAGIEKVLAGRMEKTLVQMTALREKGVMLSPYLEIGAERCQRSLVMENEMGGRGAAVDISFEMLRSGGYYKDAFQKTKLPLRVCCDVYNLPFRSSSVPFIFCYETLHHFPDPSPVVSEIYRTLSEGGNFFFDEEPYKRILHLDLYREKVASAGPAVFKTPVRQTLDLYFRQAVYNEVEHGIIENYRISLGTWKRALAPFAHKDVTLTSMQSVQTELYRPASWRRYWSAQLQGGFIGGVGWKAGTLTHSAAIRDLFICPTCKEAGAEPPLTEAGNGYICSRCRKRYPVKEGVVFLFSYGKLKELYPEIFDELLE